MAARNKKFAAQRVGTTTQILYTVPAPTPPATEIQVLLTFVNVSLNQSGKIDLWLVPNGGTPDVNNVIWDQVVLDGAFIAGRAIYWVLEEGDTIQAKSEKADSLTLRFDGLEIQE